jgi:hypothetical protein
MSEPVLEKPAVNKKALAAAAAVKIGGRTLAAGSGSWTEQGPWRERYCLGQFCAPVRYLQPKVGARVEGLYYVYYFIR